MARKKKAKEVVEEVVDAKVEETKVEETPVEEPKKDTGFQEDGTFKVNLTESNEEEVKEEVKEEVVEEVKAEETTTEEQPVIEEITDEEPQVETTTETKEVVEEQVQEIKDNSPEVELPDNIQKVVDFMKETGGTLEDYVRLNADYSKTDDGTLLNEYYRQTKPHLSQDERNFLMEDSFSYDEEIDEAKDVKRKQLAYKEEVAKARNHLEQMKGKYYEEVKMGSRLTPEAQKAMDFFNRYNEEQGEAQKLTSKQQANYEKKTNEVFNNEFKGFEFKVGEKRYRYNVNDVGTNKEAQSDLIQVFSKYVGNDNLLNDAKGYHKALFAARNADAIANHFYQQGKADAIKEVNMDSKNINMDPRKSSTVESDGVKYRVIGGDDSSNLKFKLKNY
tara:strand:+ start:1036 stop:2205 length:1170 start_codon:yes stop_codon:yes gene_type:complete